MIRESASPVSSNHGTTRSGRLANALMPEHINVDERSLANLLAYAAAYARKIKYYNTDGLYEDQDTGALLDWSPFFEKSETVFLASLMASDIHKDDKKIQKAFHQIHQLSDRKKQGENFAFLVELLLKLSEQLFQYYRKALSFGDTGALGFIVREVDQAMLGELGIQLRGFSEVLQQLAGLEGQISFPEVKTWQQRLNPILSYWDQREAVTLLRLKDATTTDAGEALKFAGARLQEYYRRLYYTLSFLEEMTPKAFEGSLLESGNHDPDVGLLIAFLRLFSHAQDHLNTFSSRHLHYYEKKVLKRKLNEATPDKTIVYFQPNPVIRGTTLASGTRLLAGLDAEGQPSHYATDEEVFVSQAKVEALKTIFVSRNPLVKTDSSYQLVTAIYAANMANSADGMGATFTGNDISWPILGEDQFDLGEDMRQMGTSTLGFAIASPILLLREGERKVTVRLQFTEDSFGTLSTLLQDIAENTEEDTSVGDIFNLVFHRPFDLSLTVKEGWLPLEKYRLLPLSETSDTYNQLILEFILPTSVEAIAHYDPAVHGGEYETRWPLLRAMLSESQPIYSYSFLRDLELEEIGIDVQVEGLRDIVVYNDIGLLDASRPFVPFGPLPSRNSFLLVGHPELFNRTLTALEIGIDWGDLPDISGGFTEHYKAYGHEIQNESFKFEVSALTDYAFRPVKKEEREFFSMFTPRGAEESTLQDSTLLQFGEEQLKRLRLQPQYNLDQLEEFTNASRAGYLKFNFRGPRMAFGHMLYPRLFAQAMAENAKPKPFSLIQEDPEPLVLPNEPYTPVINRLNVNYKATTVMNLRKMALKARNQQADERLYRLHPFGSELVFGDAHLDSPYLLPQFDDEGYLLIGLKDFSPPASISLFFDLKDTNKKFNRSPLDISWSYLQEGKWRPFSPDQMLSDTTVQFSTRGIVKLMCPATMTKGGGLMSPDLHWIRVTGSGNLNITGRCLAIIPHVVQATWVNNGDSQHLMTPPESRPAISGLAEPVAGIIGVAQTSPFFGGLPQESDEQFFVRGSERLRHKNRTVNTWDYERLILERFPAIRQVKCIGQHNYEGQLSIGEVLVIVIPALSTIDDQPKVGYHVLSDVELYLSSLSSPFAKFRVINPVYEKLRINCRVKLRPEHAHQQGIVWEELHKAIKAFICPWIREGSLKLGGSINKTELLAIINEHPHVVYTTAFSVVQVYEQQEDHLKLKDTAIPDALSELLIPSKPWSVLVPVDEHEIIFLDQDEYQSAEVTAIERMRLEADFVVVNDEENNVSNTQSKEPSPEETFLKVSTKWLLG